MAQQPPAPEMAIEEVLRVLEVLTSLGCRFWLEGGWGVDALVGTTTRRHRDLDVDFDATYEEAVLAGLADLGYRIETDWRPNRVEVVADGRGWVDLHPLQLLPDGSARQAALDGGTHEFEARFFTTGRLNGVEVPCVSLEAQLLFHSGYEPRDTDRHDLALLRRLQSGAVGHPPAAT